MSVSMNHIPNDIRVPLFYAEMDNSQANSGASQLRRLLIGLVNSDKEQASGLALPSGLSEVKQLTGNGSMLSEMYEVHRKNDPLGETWILPVSVSAGAAAKATITVDSAATAAGILSLYIADHLVPVFIASDMDTDVAAQAIIEAINKKPELPVTASVTAGAGNESKVEVLAKFKGELGNDLAVRVNVRSSAGGESLPAGLSVTLGQFSGGAGQPDLAEALAAIGDEPFEFIVHPFADAASLDAFQELMNDSAGRWSWLKQLYGHVYTAKRGTMGELVTFGRTRNDQHHTIRGVEKSKPTSVWNCAATLGARTAVFISTDPARPTQSGALVGEMQALAGTSFEVNEQNSLLWAGIATTYFEGGYERISRAVTTYQKNDYGMPDDSYVDSETMHQSAYILRRLKSSITSKYGRHKLANDGTRFGDGQAIVTPKVLRAELSASYTAMELEGIVENYDAFMEHLIVERDQNNPNRVNVLYPPDYVNQLRIVALRNEFRLQYPEQ